MTGLDSHIKRDPFFRRRWVHVTAIAVLVVGLIVAFGTTVQKRIPEPVEYADRMFIATNETRVEAGLPPLVWSSCVTGIATDAADGYQFELNVSPEVKSVDCAGLTFGGELVARGARTPEEVIDRWSQLQRQSEVLLDPAATHIGIGCFAGGTPSNPQATCSVITATR